MKRLLFYCGMALLALGLLLALGGFSWLVGTRDGARLVLTTAAELAGFRVKLGGVEGRLRDKLQITGLRLEKPQLKIEVDRLELDWQGRELLHRYLSIETLTLDGVRVQDDAPPSHKAPDLAWPRVGTLARSCAARIGSLKLAHLKYRHGSAAPFVLDRAAGTLSYRDGVVTLGRLSGEMPQGKLSGEAVAGFGIPLLRLDLVYLLAQPVSGMDLVSLQTRLKAGHDPEQLAGSLALAGRGGGKQQLELTGTLALTRHEFRLRGLNLARPGRRGVLTGSGSLALTAAEPVITLALAGSDLDLSEELKQPTRLTGTLDVTGTVSSYRGKFALSNRGPGWRSAALTAHYRGDKTGVKLSQLAGELLRGTLTGNLELNWSKGFLARGRLSGRGLDPGRLAADWSGRVNLDLAGELALPTRGLMRGKLNGRLLESRLHGQELQGELAGAFVGEQVTVERLFLKGRGFELSGSGQLDDRLDLTARVADLSRLVPGSAGSLEADLWVRWRDGELSGSATGQGGKLAGYGARVAAARFSAQLGAAPSYPVSLDASLQGLSLGQQTLDTAQLSLDGTGARHTLKAGVTSTNFTARLELAGGYQDGVWRGSLTQLSGQDRIGPWGTVAPAQLVLSSSRIYLSSLELRGTGGERVQLAADLALHPYSGTLQGSWTTLDLARVNAWVSGVRLVGTSSGQASLRLLPGQRILLSARAFAQGSVDYGGRVLQLDRVALTADGDAAGLHAAVDLALGGGAGTAHLGFESRAPATLALPKQGDLSLQCSDLNLALLGPFLPQGLRLDGRLAGVGAGRLNPGMQLDLKGNLALTQGVFVWHSAEQDFNASFRKAELTCAWHGSGTSGRLRLAGDVEASGEYLAHGERLVLERFSLRLDADERGTRAGLNLALPGGAVIRGSLASPAQLGAGVPETGDFALEWGGIDPVLLKPWLPGALNLKGQLSGETKGRLLPGKRLEASGAAEFSQGVAGWQGTNGELKANLRSASLSFDWRGDQLTGELALSLANYGSLKGHLRLPVPARLPVAAAPAGALEGYFTGRVQELGFLTSIFPGVVQESHGDLDVDLHLAGTWQEPTMRGGLTVAKAGAYLPSAGIRVSDVTLTARLTREEILIEGFRAVSGPGHLEGSAALKLKGLQVVSYRASLNGDRFQTVYLPELQLFTSPKLVLEGEGKRVTVNGEVRVPEMLISGPPTRSVVQSSRDVVLEGVPESDRHRAFPLQVEGRVRLVLGDKVQVKAEGIDTMLGGEMELALDGIDNITSRGEIHVVKGRYKAYGVDLEIVRGRLYYVDGPIDKPTLDILALRTIAEVKAGVTVAGPLGAQVVKLYSEPAMPDVDIMAYIVLGHPLGSGSGDQAGLVAGAASSLLSFGQSESLQDQIKDRLGLSVLGVETVNQANAGLMGYKEIPITPPRMAPKTISTGESLFIVGKYLTPRIYLSYGRSLVTGDSLFQLRYDVSRHVQIETQSGSESGADIYYKLEFN